MVLFLTKLLLDEKNQLSKVWLAAHWEKKLTRYHIYQINIENSIQEIMDKELTLDLRLSGHLLVGIVKIFSRKTLYLLNECTSIFTKVKIFQPGITDLPMHRMTLPVNSITLPEILDNFNAFEAGKVEEIISSNQSRREDITLKETYGNLSIIDDYFGDKLDEVNQGNFIDDDPNLIALLEQRDMDHELEKTTMQALISDAMDTNSIDGDHFHSDLSSDETTKSKSVKRGVKYGSAHISINFDLVSVGEIVHYSSIKKSELVLEPLPVTFKLEERGKRQKRKLIIDEVKELSRDKIEGQYKDTKDVTSLLDLAPPSKRLMTLKQIGGTDGLFHLPGLKCGNKRLLNLYQRNLKIDEKNSNIVESSGEESAYGSIDRQHSHSDDLFSEESMEIENAINNRDGINNGMNDNEPDVFIDAGIQIDYSEQQSQPINFSNEIQKEMSLSEGLETGTYYLQEKVIEMFKCIASILTEDSSSTKFSSLVKNERRIKVARTFSFLLMLKKFEIIELQQMENWGEIFISRGINFIPAYTELGD